MSARSDGEKEKKMAGEGRWQGKEGFSACIICPRVILRCHWVLGLAENVAKPCTAYFGILAFYCLL